MVFKSLRRGRRSLTRRLSSWMTRLYRPFLETLETRTLLAASVFSTSLPAVVSTSGTALAFNGINDYLITPNLQSAFSTSTVTIEGWFKATGAGVIVTELGHATLNDPQWHDSQIEITGTGEVKARVWNLNPVSLGTAAFGAWHYVALRYDSSTSVLDGFLDGVHSATASSGARQTPVASGNGQFYAFGAADTTTLGSGAYFNGSLDDLSIWNTARTNANIQADMSQPPAAGATGLVASYQLDDGSGLTAADATTHFAASLGGGAVAAAPSWVTSSAPIKGVVTTGLGSTQAAIDHFAVLFSGALSGSSATSASNYSLVGSAGDPTYTLTPTYVSGSDTVTFTMSPEPLQPGTYTFQTLAGLDDASNAGVTPFSMQFTITNPPAGQIALTTHGTEFVPGAPLCQ